MPWIIERYFRAAISGFTFRKLLNASLALLEMKLGVVNVRSAPFVLRIEPCNFCNLRCPLCACGNRTDLRQKGFITTDDFLHILEQNQHSAMIVRLDGMGEPTLHPEIFSLIKTAKSFGMSVIMHSNFNTPACQDLKQFVECGLDRLVISIDGATQETHAQYRIGGDLGLVINRISKLVEVRRQLGAKNPLIEIQTVDFEFNRNQRPLLRQMSRELGVDRFQITEADQSTHNAPYNPSKPRRCPWLWTVLTVAWNLDYRSCTNAWSLPWPRLNLRQIPSNEWWNHPVMQRARRYNTDKSSRIIADDNGCKCNRCYEMLVVPLEGAYRCE